ncbi:MAG TPA: DHA2 family efflux MFS transporter permease subunit [Steroidobacteraceae bacterium]|nr:DHA2 family efflux MFS transporter permease subunit [Steroidobacteraceae bacterium]
MSSADIADPAVSETRAPLAPSAAVPAAPAPLVGSARTLVAIALALGTFMQVLDTSIANVAIPTIAGNLGVSPDEGTWVITSFAVSNGIAVPLTGWLMQRYGVVRTFVLSVLLFTIASFLCGISWSLSSLVVFRVLQGAVSGPMIPGSQALLLSVFPPQKRGTALAIWSMTTLIAPIAGPVLGGYISDNWTWPWIFYINVPVGVVVSLLCWRYLGQRDTPTRRLPIDTVGLGLLVVWVGALQVMLDKGKDLDWFSSPAIVVLAAVSVVGFVAWLIWELTDAHPVVDLSLFRVPSFRIGTIAFCLGYAVFFGNVVLMPLWLQTQLNYTATWAGLVAAPSGLVALLLSPLFGRMIGKVDARWLATLGFISYGLSYFMRSGFTADASFAAFVMPQLVMGVGMSVFFVAMLAILLDGLPPQRVPSASGVSNFSRIVAASFATSITTTLWDRREALHQTRLADAANSASTGLAQALHGLSNLGLSGQASSALLSHSLIDQAYLLSTLDYFWISALLMVPPLILLWFAPRPAGGASVAAAD